MKNIIVHCQTKELWDKVQKKMFETSEWTDDCKQLFDAWDEFKSESCISILEGDNWKMMYCHKRHYKNEFPQVPIISAEEYLGIKKENLGMEKDDKLEKLLIEFAVRRGILDFGFQCGTILHRYIMKANDEKTFDLLQKIKTDIFSCLDEYMEESTKNQVKSTKE